MLSLSNYCIETTRNSTEEESMYPDKEGEKGWEFLCALQHLST